MKIGILTQPLQHNYGGILQNWALQQVLKRMGYEPETIARQYDAPKPSLCLQLKRCVSFGKCLVKKTMLHDKSIGLMNPFGRIYAPQLYLRYKYPYVDVEFVNSQINKSKTLYTDKELRDYISSCNFDGFIVGSDQVWREDYSPNILSYFIDFLPEVDKTKRIAYAASFGKGQDYISVDKMPECRRLLGRFDSVSVRENEGIEIVKKDFGREQVEKVLDPTLLLSASDYEKLIRPEDRHSKPYIASYILDGTDDKATILNQIAGIKNLRVNGIDIEVKAEGMPTVSQWLANFADADFVVTDSFHGCVFSIIFGKPFIAIANVERGLDRFISLLGEFGLEDRLIFNVKDFEDRKDHLLTSPDYKLVNKRLGELRASSMKFLIDALA